MGKNLYVGNLPYSAQEADLENLFGQSGKVASVKIISDRYSGKSKGFGFVEMESDEDAQKAIQELNGKDMEGRSLIVNEARPRKEGGRGGGGGGRRFNRN